MFEEVLTGFLAANCNHLVGTTAGFNNLLIHLSTSTCGGARLKKHSETIEDLTPFLGIVCSPVRNPGTKSTTTGNICY